MIRVGKLADYGLLILAHLAEHNQQLVSAEQLASDTGLAKATTRKVLNQLVSAHLVNTQRGPSGGYSIAKPSDEISLLAAICAVEGPLSLTACCAENATCDIMESCRLKTQWPSVNELMSNLLESITLDDLLKHNQPGQFAGILQRRQPAANQPLSPISAPVTFSSDRSKSS